MNEDPISMQGSFPRSVVYRIAMLTEAGFIPEECDILRDTVAKKLKDYLKWFVEKLKILLHQSTYVYCMADPYGVLEPGEAFLSFSEPWADPDTGFKTSIVLGDALVGRNPANLPSDIQKVNFVYRPELTTIHDVVVFSSKGMVPHASLLSGGDYDGDEVWTCWHPDIVKAFQNSPDGPPDHITPEDCGIIKKSTALGEVLKQQSEGNVDRLLARALDFNLKPSLLGLVTIEHMKLVYHKNLCNPGATKLAALAAYLVDARKQGYELEEETWWRIRAECSGRDELKLPAYRSSEVDPPSDVKRTNINDHLRFVVAYKEMQRILTDFNKRWRPDPVANKQPDQKHDSVLSNIWTTAWIRAKSEKKAGNDTCYRILKALQDEIDSIVTDWNLGSNLQDSDPDRFPSLVNQCHERFRELKPFLLEGYEHDINRRFEDEKDRC